MIALAVVAIGLVAASTSIARLTANGTYLRDKTLAHWIAMNKLAEMRLAESWPDTGKTDDDIDYAGLTWHWTAEVTPTEVKELRRIDLTIARKDKDKEHVVATLAGFIGQPRPTAGLPAPWTGAGRAGGIPGPGNGNETPQPEETPPDEGDGDSNGDSGNDEGGDENGDQEQP